MTFSLTDLRCCVYEHLNGGEPDDKGKCGENENGRNKVASDAVGYQLDRSLGGRESHDTVYTLSNMYTCVYSGASLIQITEVPLHVVV